MSNPLLWQVVLKLVTALDLLDELRLVPVSARLAADVAGVPDSVASDAFDLLAVGGLVRRELQARPVDTYRLAPALRNGDGARHREVRLRVLAAAAEAAATSADAARALELAEQYGVTRTSAEAWLRTLAGEGFVSAADPPAHLRLRAPGVGVPFAEARARVLATVVAFELLGGEPQDGLRIATEPHDGVTALLRRPPLDGVKAVLLDLRHPSLGSWLEPNVRPEGGAGWQLARGASYRAALSSPGVDPPGPVRRIVAILDLAPVRPRDTDAIRWVVEGDLAEAVGVGAGTDGGAFRRALDGAIQGGQIATRGHVEREYALRRAERVHGSGARPVRAPGGPVLEQIRAAVRIAAGAGPVVPTELFWQAIGLPVGRRTDVHERVAALSGSGVVHVSSEGFRLCSLGAH